MGWGLRKDGGLGEDEEGDGEGMGTEMGMRKEMGIGRRGDGGLGGAVEGRVSRGWGRGMRCGGLWKEVWREREGMGRQIRMRKQWEAGG